jgi:hypothetical protein
MVWAVLTLLVVVWLLGLIGQVGGGWIWVPFGLAVVLFIAARRPRPA